MTEKEYPDTSNEIDFKSPTAWSFTHNWTTHDVGNFIQDIGYPQFAPCFTNNMVNGKTLKDLTIFDLQRMGVDNMVDAMRMHTIIKRASNKATYNFKIPDEPPNFSYYRNRKGSEDQDGIKVPPAKPFYMEPIKDKDLKLLQRDMQARYKRYHLTLPTIHHQRSVCTRKMADTMAHATLHI